MSHIITVSGKPDKQRLMRINELPWPSSTQEAVELQKELVNRLALNGSAEGVDLVAGVDVSSFISTPVLVGAVVVWSLKKKKIVDSAIARSATNFPYIPGLLAFRELPALMGALQKLATEPDVVICDGQGTAHPRGLGIACHLGLYINVPTLGCGKSRLIGTYDVPGLKKGNSTVLYYKNREVGRVVRTRDNVKPVFVSAGNNISQESASHLVVSACSKYRIPDPVRAAHKLAGEVMGDLRP